MDLIKKFHAFKMICPQVKIRFAYLQTGLQTREMEMGHAVTSGRHTKIFGWLRQYSPRQNITWTYRHNNWSTRKGIWIWQSSQVITLSV